MGNKKLRNTLLAFAMTPFFALAATGCWKATSKDKTPKFSQSEAYSTLRNLTLKDNFLVDSGSNAVKVGYINKQDMSTDWSESNIPEASKEGIADELGVPITSDSYIYKNDQEYGYNYLDNTGYYYQMSMEYDKDENGKHLETESYKISEMELTKKSGNNFYKYYYDYTSYGNDTKRVFLVDDKYAVNQYSNEAFEQANEGLSLLSKYINPNETLDSFKQNTEQIGIGIIESLGDFSIDTAPQNSQSSAEITLTDGTYSLSLSLTIEDYLLEEQSLADIAITTTLSFNETTIKTLNFNFSISYDVDLNCNDFPEYTGNLTFSDDDHISVSISNSLNASVDFNKSFDSSIINQNTSDYHGTGTNNEIIADSTRINFIFVDIENYSSGSYSFTFNKPLNLEQNPPYLFNNEHITKTYYWDQECTIPVQSSDTAPSYDTNIYVKLTIEEGYAAIFEQTIYRDGSKSSKNYQCHDISSPYTYKIQTPESYDILKVTVNGNEVSNYGEGITVSQPKLYIISVYISTW